MRHAHRYALAFTASGTLPIPDFSIPSATCHNRTAAACGEKMERSFREVQKPSDGGFKRSSTAACIDYGGNNCEGRRMEVGGRSATSHAAPLREPIISESETVRPSRNDFQHENIKESQKMPELSGNPFGGGATLSQLVRRPRPFQQPLPATTMIYERSFSNLAAVTGNSS